MKFMTKLLAVLVGVVAYVVARRLFSYETEVLTFDKLPDGIQAWYNRGNMMKVNGQNMFYIRQNCSDPTMKNPPTFALLHGFPSSSYEYHKVLDKLRKWGNVIVNDHIGFGFSDKPTEYTYSISEAAENILALWMQLNITKAHVISHDMGDTVLTEILARRHRHMLPRHFDGFFQTITFTNGGMNIARINFRITQSVMLYKPVGKTFLSIAKALGMQEFAFKKQLSSVWSPVANRDQRDKDIYELYILNQFTGAAENVINTIYYLWDRYNFEFRWYAALRVIDVPTRFIWGDSDDVSPISIPMFFSDIVPNFDLTIVPGAGHFWMLECPDVWLKEMLRIVEGENDSGGEQSKCSQ